MTITDTDLQQFVINKLTQAQYNNIPAPSSTEVYAITDGKISSDEVTDTNATNKFVTGSDITNWNGKQNATDNSLDTTSKTIVGAINEVDAIAKGANQALSYSSYSTMVTAFNSASATSYNVGQNIYIQTVDVPDLWVSSVESTSSTYTYTTDAAFISDLNTNGYVQVGYYRLSALETQKVDLTNYVTNTDYATQSTGGVIKVWTSYNSDNELGLNISTES